MIFQRVNYIFGSCAAAGVFGKAIRNPVIGFQMCVFFCKSLFSLLLEKIK
jgi:hypothetical protein